MLHRPEFLHSALYEFNFFSVTQNLSICLFVSLSDGKLITLLVLQQAPVGMIHITIAIADSEIQSTLPPYSVPLGHNIE